MLSGLFALILAVSPANAKKAAALSHRSAIEYNAGDLDRALADATAAYELDPLPALLFNLGQCHRALEHWSKALFLYRNYLRLRPNAGNRSLVLKLIAEMEAKSGKSAPPAAASLPVAPEPPKAAPQRTPAPVPPPAVLVLVPEPPVRPPPAKAATKPMAARPAPAAAVSAAPVKPRKKRLTPAVLGIGAGGIAGVAAGSVLGFLSASSFNGDNPVSAGGATWHHVGAGQYHAGQSEALAADVLWGVGGALIVTAAILAFTR